MHERRCTDGGLGLQPDQLGQLLRSFDKNGDGQIDYNEFVQVFHHQGQGAGVLTCFMSRLGFAMDKCWL